MTGPGGLGLLAQPLWQRLLPAMTIEAGTLLATGRRHRRLELVTVRLTNADIAGALGLTVPCAACGAAIHPFRCRRGKSAGRAERPNRLFLALSCDLTTRFGCSRGLAVSSAYESVIAAIQGRTRQLDLFA